MIEFILLYYTKYWFTTPLASSAARHDLDFMSSILEYRKVNSRLSFEVLRSAYRHLCYLTPQLITLSLTDTGLEDKNRQDIASELHSKDRLDISTGKPMFPMITYGPTVTRENMSSLVGPESWLVFNLLNITGSQDWLLSPITTWPLSPEYKKLLEFTTNLTIINDLAERGIHLATDFINRVESEDQRQALFQVVEEFRGRVKDTNKSSLQLC